MVDCPEDPARMEPDGPLTAVGTLLSWTFSRMMPGKGTEPAGAFTSSAVRMPTGVLLMEESMTVIEPTAWKLLLSAEMSMPVPQLLILIPWYVQPQSHECLIAVTA